MTLVSIALQAGHRSKTFIGHLKSDQFLLKGLPKSLSKILLTRKRDASDAVTNWPLMMI